MKYPKPKIVKMADHQAKLLNNASAYIRIIVTMYYTTTTPITPCHDLA